MEDASKKKLLIAAAAAAFVLRLILSACAEPVRILTPKGSLNVRRKPNMNATVLGTLENRSLVEVEEVEGDWARTIYKGGTAYVKAEFLLLPSLLTD